MIRKRIIVLQFVFLLLLILSLFFLFDFTRLKNISFNEKTNQYSCLYKGQIRHYIVSFPQNFNSLSKTEKSKCPIVLMLHGYGSSAVTFKKQTTFDIDATQRGYVVVYVSGTVNPNVQGSDSGWHYNNDSLSKNDMGFLTKLLSYISYENGLSSKKYVVGFSNGAFMATKLAVIKGNLFNGVVSVGGMMPDSVWVKRKKTVNIGFMQINGTKDEVVPMRMNDSHKNNPNPPMEDVIDYWRRANGLVDIPQIVQISSKVKLENYSDKVCWVIIDKGVHSWPSQNYCEININDVILDFFDKL